MRWREMNCEGRGGEERRDVMWLVEMRYEDMK